MPVRPMGQSCLLHNRIYDMEVLVTKTVVSFGVVKAFNFVFQILWPATECDDLWGQGF